MKNVVVRSQNIVEFEKYNTQDVCLAAR
jgi:hypothetical protein